MATGSNELEDVGIHIPLPKKRRLTLYKRCIICQCDRNEKLRKAKESSISNLVSALFIRRDDVYERLCTEITYLKDEDNEIQWHSTCYSTYTSQENIKYAAALPGNQEKESVEESSVRCSRSAAIPMDWSKCLFCGNKTHKKSKEMNNVSTFEACNTIKTVAEATDNHRILHILRGVNNDLVAAEAKYHKSCFASYTSKSNIKHKTFKEAHDESLYSLAFKELASSIENGIDEGKAYDMTSLLSMYQNSLQSKGVNGDSYSRQRLKLRLQNHFAERIVFHQPFDKRKPELVYSSKISLQDVINAAVDLHPSKQQDSSSNETSSAKTNYIFEAAKMIKNDIKQCSGICTRPLDVNDLNQETVRRIVPNRLYWLLRWIIGCDVEDASTNAADERRILSIAQDIIHCSSNARVKTPKHISLAISVHHSTGSKQIVTLLNRMGYCSSYDELKSVDTSLALEVLAKSDEYGTVLPSNISLGSFVQIAADNSDFNEETLDGKNTTHATTMVIYQRKPFGPAPKPTVLGDHGERRRTLQDLGNIYEIQDFSAFGRRPVISSFIGQIDIQWYDGATSNFVKASNMDTLWALLRMNPPRLQQLTITDMQQPESQLVPSWSGFNSMLFPDVQRSTTIGYCPLINGSSSEFSTIYTVMKHAQKVSASMCQQDTVITFDLAIYIKAKQIQWRSPDEFFDTVIRMGGFHIALNFLSVIGKKYTNSGLDDLLVESGVYAAGSTSALIMGKSYNRGVRAHKLVSEALFRLTWRAFSKWLSSKPIQEASIDEEELLAKINTCRHAVKDHSNVSENVKELECQVQQVMSVFNEFKEESRAKSKIFAFWEEYATMVNILLQFIKAERTGDWNLHLAATANMVPYFFAMDRQNYARWLPVYLAEMNQLHDKHPEVHQQFVDGNHAVSRSDNQPFSQVWTDMALEQSINADSKSKGGIVGITQSQSALERWFLTVHERASVTTALKEMYAIRDSDRLGSHKEVKPKRMKRDEDDVEKLISCFSSDLMTDPFDGDADQLLNLATGVVLPAELTESLLKSTEKGTQQMNAFIQDRLNTNKVSFWDPLKQLKIKTFGSMKKKIQVKATDEKVVTVEADRNLFGRLLIAANAREINLRDVLGYELSPVPFSLAHCDGSLRKTNKSILFSILEKNVSVAARLPAPTLETTSVHLIDGMALVQMVKTGGASTFGELANKYFSIATEPLSQNGCDRLDIVFDQYWDKSIKSCERSRRGLSSALEVKINSPSTPIPKQWAKYIANPVNKTNLCIFLTNAFTVLGQEKQPLNKQLVIGGGCSDGESALSIRRGSRVETIRELKADHEEADTRLLLHAKHASQPDRRIVIHSPDTDVFVLSISFYEELGCKELWFRTGVKDRLRYIPVHEVSNNIGKKMCKALPAFHALTGCDSTSAFAGVGKKRGYDILSQCERHQESMSLLGQQPSLTEEMIEQCTSFVVSLYPSTKRTPTTMDELRYIMFCQKKQKSELLPPTSDSLCQHLKRVNYQTLVWRRSLVGAQELPQPQCHGWKEEDGALVSVLMTNDPAPRSILELTTCSCKKSACRSNCSCTNNGLCCTEACFCMADNETCMNPHGSLLLAEDSDSDDAD